MAITGIAVLVAAFVLVRLLRARVKPAKPELAGEVIET
jgi:hypothetical protein